LLEVGQLEATTDARFINNAFGYSGPAKLYFDKASEPYGKRRTDQVTSMQIWSRTGHGIV
jgi:hypothetical protein